MLAPDDVVAAAATAQAALRPVIGRDWSVRAGTLDWDVEQTITHMIGATAKYTLYLASRCEHFIGLSVTRWPDATDEEVIDSLVPWPRNSRIVADHSDGAGLSSAITAEVAIVAGLPDAAGGWRCGTRRGLLPDHLPRPAPADGDKVAAVRCARSRESTPTSSRRCPLPAHRTARPTKGAPNWLTLGCPHPPDPWIHVDAGDRRGRGQRTVRWWTKSCAA